MKVAVSFKKSEEGSALLVTLILASLLGFALASYFKMVQFQNNSIIESQHWNAAIPYAEAGIEEALTHLNTIGDDNRASNGWTAATNQFTISRTLGEGRFTVYIDNQRQPIVTSTGYAKVPRTGREVQRTVVVTTTRVNSGMKGIVAKGNVTMVGNAAVDSFDSGDPAFSTNGRYDPSKNKDNGYVGSVNGGVSAEGRGVWGRLATGATGWATGNAGDKAHMATSTGIKEGYYTKDLNVYFDDVSVPFNGGAFGPEYNKTLTLTNFAYTSSITNSTSMPNPAPPDLTSELQTITRSTKPSVWSGTLTTNISAYTSSSMPAAGTYVGNITTRNVVEGRGRNRHTVTYYDYQKITGYTFNTIVHSWALSSALPTTTTENYAMVFGSGNYEVSSVSVASSDKILITGDAVVYVPGDFQMTGNSELIIMPGASLKLYVGGSTAKFAGGGILNYSQDATKFSYFGLPTNKNLLISGNASFTGNIYAPSSDMQLGGGGTDIYDVVGASVTNTVRMNGHFNFHYDERLGRIGGKAQFKVASWNEV